MSKSTKKKIFTGKQNKWNKKNKTNEKAAWKVRTLLDQPSDHRSHSVQISCNTSLLAFLISVKNSDSQQR